jgi:formylglycine-generating enzyme required for sulfatase activity
LVDVYYDLASASNALTVSVAVSTNSGAAFNAPAGSLTGDLGGSITPGTGKHVVWNAGTDLSALYFPNVKVRVTADDATAPSGMALIPAGSFTMGDSVDGDSSALPLHTVYVSAFYMDKYDVTLALWQQVYNWAITHGYSFDYAGSGKAANHPVQTIDWYDCVKWCNARSEREGRTPAYYTSAAQTAVYRSGDIDITNGCVNWNSGYRLPTEAEWEKAARGGASGQRFPWGNTISWSQANYYARPMSAGGYAYDVNPTQGYNPTFNDGVWPYTNPVGYFAPNGYGLYDMAGNVWQWCWDRYGSYSSSSQNDPRGPTSGTYRVDRGGNWGYYAFGCRTAFRDYDYGPTSWNYGIGFRSVLSPGQ